MLLHISKNRSLDEVQKDFNLQYPYLKIDFYKKNDPATGMSARHQLRNNISIQAAGLTNSGDIDISDMMTVEQLEKLFRDQFGLLVQVSRKSGMIWLETTISDSWTLKQQNDHGRELSEPVKKKFEPGLNEKDYD